MTSPSLEKDKWPRVYWFLLVMTSPLVSSLPEGTVMALVGVVPLQARVWMEEADVCVVAASENAIKPYQ